MNFYLSRYAFRDQIIRSNPSNSLGLVVVIPCCNETDLITSLISLVECQQPKPDVEVIVVINASENADEALLRQNESTFKETKSWIEKQNSSWLKFHLIQENSLPKKHAGVGLARKIGMDEAVRRFEQVNNLNGVIVCFDADSLCEKNYLAEIEKHFNQNPKTPAASIHFEHPIEGNEYDEKIYNGIMQYELHLRYYKNGLQYAGLPYAYHTIGSSMAVRSTAYQKQNGMNKRKAGEDFYFLQKLIPLGDFTEIKTTKVIPSPRVSDRVPFGTGKAMQDWLDSSDEEMLSYNVQSFKDLKNFVEQVPNLYEQTNVELPVSVRAFLASIDFEESLNKIKANATSEKHFVKLFFNWFNAFKVLKYMHFARDNYYVDVLVSEAANDLLVCLGLEKEQTLRNLLLRFRELDL